ncbi:MAG: nitroreductase [Planctomycetota bacterium]
MRKPMMMLKKLFFAVYRCLLPAKLRVWIRNVFKENPLKTRIKLLRNYRYDQKRFHRWSAISKNQGRKMNLWSLITMDYHRIEKGLSLPEPRPGFGRYAVDKLLTNIDLFHSLYGYDDVFKTSMFTLEAYREFNINAGFNYDDLWLRVDQLKALVESNDTDNEVCGGVKPTGRLQIHERIPDGVEGFLTSRHSVRHYTDEPVGEDVIARVVKIAQRTPSVCNRQAWRVYALYDKERKAEILKWQNGNGGFGDQAACVLAVTCDLRHFVSVGERNQAWVDGGMFAMSILYALHAQGLGACPLNCSNEWRQDLSMRKAADIPGEDSIIMLISVGHLPESFQVANSKRKPLDEVLHKR